MSIPSVKATITLICDPLVIEIGGMEQSIAETASIARRSILKMSPYHRYRRLITLEPFGLPSKTHRYLVHSRRDLLEYIDVLTEYSLWQIEGVVFRKELFTMNDSGARIQHRYVEVETAIEMLSGEIAWVLAAIKAAGEPLQKRCAHETGEEPSIVSISSAIGLFMNDNLRRTLGAIRKDTSLQDVAALKTRMDPQTS